MWSGSSLYARMLWVLKRGCVARPHSGISTRPGDKLRYPILHAGRVSTSDRSPLQLPDAVAPDGFAIGIIGGDGAGKSILLPRFARISIAGYSSNRNTGLCLKNQIFSALAPPSESYRQRGRSAPNHKQKVLCGAYRHVNVSHLPEFELVDADAGRGRYPWFGPNLLSYGQLMCSNPVGLVIVQVTRELGGNYVEEI